MEYIKREIEATILEASRYYAAVILTEPRQVGKSTTLRRLSEAGHREAALDDLEARRIAKTDPELFLSLYPPPLLVDEVQYAPELFSRIKMAVDNGAVPGSYWMTGSQPFRLMELAQESLAGRAAILQMSALSQGEIYGAEQAELFSPELAKLQERARGRTPIDTAAQYEQIWQGSLPGYISGKVPKRDLFYSSYLQS